MQVRSGSSWGAWVAVIVLWGTAFALACHLEGREALRVPPDISAVDRVLGVSRRALSDSFFEEADNYFHQGVKHQRPKAFTNTWYARMQEMVSPSTHQHLHGLEAREILPWLNLAVRSDPHNVPACLTTAYWLSSTLKRSDVAERLLIEAQLANPGDYRIFLERAKIAFRGHDDHKAARLFDAALRLWRPDVGGDEEAAIEDRAQILSFRAFLYEIAGDTQMALKLFREAWQLSPQNHSLAERVRAMERGVSFVDQDRALWEQGFMAEHMADDDDRSEHCLRGGMH